MRQLSLLEQSRIEKPQLGDAEHVAAIADRALQRLEAEAPVDLEMVASYHGIDAVRLATLPDAGWLLSDPETGQVEIRIRAGDSRGRQRFTGFHEVTHTFFKGYRRQRQRRCDPPQTGVSRDTEGLCDLGAAEFLLPTRLVARDLRDADFGLDLVTELAASYDASLQATAHRLVDLWPEDTLLVVAEIRKKPVEANDSAAVPKLRVNYCWKNGNWPFIRPHKSLNDPLIERAIGGEAVDARDVILREICADEIEGLDLSIRHSPYSDQKGVTHDRVFMLYRRPAIPV